MKVANGSSLITAAVVTVIVLLSVGSAEAGITLDSVSGLWGLDTIQCGVPVELRFRWDGAEIGSSNVVIGSSNGFRLYDNGSGAIWTYPLGADVGGQWNPAIAWDDYFDLGIFVNLFPDPLGGVISDTIGFGGARLFQNGMPDTFNDVFAIIQVQPDCNSHSKELCIDSTWYPPSNPWKWSATGGQSDFVPSWDGPHCFAIFDPNTQPDLVVAPDSLSFDAVSGGAPPPSQTLNIGSSGASVDFSLTKSAAWLNVVPASGNTPQAVTVSVTTGLGAGTYYDTIQVSSTTAGNSPVFVPVRLTLAPPPPEIATDVDSVGFVAFEGGANPADELVVVTNIGGGSLSLSVSTAGPWLAAALGVADTVILSADNAGLTVGIYYDTLVITDPAATNSPYRIPVTFEIIIPPIIAVDQSSLLFQTVLGMAPAQQQLTITNDGGGPWFLNLTNDQPWMTVAPDSGAADPFIATVSIDSVGLGLGDNYDTLWISEANATNSPFYVPVIVIAYNYPNINCPAGPIDIALAGLGVEVCVPLQITDADSVSTSYGFWSGDQLCFTADSVGSYFITVTASNPVGEVTCVIVINISLIGPAPVVVSFTPAQNGPAISRASVITATFDIDMNPSTINGSNFVVAGQSSGIIPGSCSYDGPARTATFTPSGPFVWGDQIVVSLTSGLESSGGSGLGTGFVWTFTIETSPSLAIFDSTVVYATGGNPNSLIAADFNADGFVDLATSSWMSHNLSILMNDGAGGFGSPVINAIPFANNLTGADFDSDGDVDLATVHTVTNMVTLHINDGAGLFSVGDVASVSLSPTDICVGDFDADGDFDLATANQGSGDITVLFNNGDATFVVSPSAAVGSTPVAICAVDVDNDGDLDLVSVDAASDSVAVLLNDGSGSFGGPVSYLVGDEPLGVFASNFNGDLYADLVTANGGVSDGVSVLFNHGDGSFAPRDDWAAQDRTGAVAAADLDGDGSIDIATGNGSPGNSVSVLLNNGDSTFTPHVDYSVGVDPTAIMAVDVDGDGDLDLVTANNGSDSVTVLINRSDPPEITCPGGPIDTTICALQPICISLPIAYADYIDAGGASWANDSLCFTPISAGSYSYIVTAGNIIGESACTVTVNVHRVLEATPDNMLFVTTSSDIVPPPDQIVNLSSPCPPGSIDWELTFFSSGNWVVVDKITGSNPDQVIVSANTVGMAEGIYDGFLAFRDGPSGPILTTVNLSLFIGAGANVGGDVVEPGASVVIPINIYPDSGLLGYTIPLRYTVGALKKQFDGVILDSVVIDSNYADSSLTLPDSGMIMVMRTTQDPPLPDSTIKVADIFFTIDSAVAGEMVTIDTATFEMTFAPYTYVFEYAEGPTVPEFSPGVIIIVDTLEPDITCPEGPIEVAVNAGGQYCLSLPIINVDSVEVNGGAPGYWWQDNTLCFDAESAGVYPIHVMGWNIWGTAFCDFVVEVVDTSMCSFEIATVSAGIGEVVDVQIYAHRIDNLGSISFSIAYPDSLLQVQSVSSDYLFGFQYVDAAGQVDLTWEDFASPVSISDSQPILTISMMDVYSASATAPLLWVGQNQVLDDLGQPLPWIKYCDGSVSIIGPDVEGSCAIEPDTMYVIWETALDTVFAVIYIGQFSDGYLAGDVELSSLMVNGVFAPQSAEVIPSYPGWDGEAIKATVVAAQMFLGLGPLWDVTTQAFSVSGDLFSGSRFLAEGQMVVSGRIHGDVTLDGTIDISDLTYLVEYLFHSGPSPRDIETADADVSGTIDIGDVIYLVNLLF